MKTFVLPSSLLPEAEASFCSSVPGAGSGPAADEFLWSGRPWVAVRESTKAFVRELSDASGRRHFFLEGYPGSGKSFALLSAAAWARESGWAVVYLPTGRLVTAGGNWTRAEDDLIDTSQARRLLEALVAGVGQARLSEAKVGEQTLDDALQGLDEEELAAAGGAPVAGAGEAAQGEAEAAQGSSSSSASSSLSALDVARWGLSSSASAAVSTRAYVASLRSLVLSASPASPVLVAIDDYDALFHDTSYGQPEHTFYRRKIYADELRLARALRVLGDRDAGAPSAAPVSDGAPAGARFAVARGTGRARVPASLKLPLVKGSILRVPRLDRDEATARARYAADLGLCPPLPEGDSATLDRIVALSGGNARDLRVNALALALADSVVGPSFGFNASKKIAAEVVGDYGRWAEIEPADEDEETQANTLAAANEQ